MPLVETKRGKIWFADHRSSDKIPLLLIHGAGASHLDFPGELRRLNSIAPDLPGHGKSPGAGRDTVADYAADIVALLDALNIHQAVITGHSMGGAVAQTIALEDPQRVKGLVLLATADYLPVNPTILGGVLTDTKATLQMIIKWEWAKTAPDELKQKALVQLMQTDAKVIHGDYLACSRFDVRGRLAAVNLPALIIGGTVDKMTPAAWLEELSQSLPNARLHLIEGGGHMMMLEQPAKVAGFVKDWLETL